MDKEGCAGGKEMKKPETRIYEGRILSTICYTNQTPTLRIGRNCFFPQYCDGVFILTRFIRGLEGKNVRLTLKVIQ